MRLYLIRHPQPLIAAGICYGSSDIPVDPGEQARATHVLAAQLPRHTSIHTSPLLRCSGLAHALARLTGAPQVVTDARLAEMDFGAWEQCSWDQIPRAEIDAWCADPLDCRPGGGESVRIMVTRVRAFLQELQQQQIAQAILVCHAGTIRILQACALHEDTSQIGLAAYASRTSAGYGELQVLELATKR